MKTALLAVTALFIAGCAQESGDLPLMGEGAGGLPEFSSISNTRERKKAFFDYLRPLVEEENSRVMQQRQRLLGLYEDHAGMGMIGWEDREWLKRLLDEYELEGLNVRDPSRWDSLLRRVDIVPVDLALIQAAKESGWGSSRFARQGYNLYGQRCFSEGCGIVPAGRISGETYEVAAFVTVSASVRSYIHNLNTHPSYRRFRRLRFGQRLEDQTPDGYTLAEGLPYYSERRYRYLDEIRAMIKVNRPFMES